MGLSMSQALSITLPPLHDDDRIMEHYADGPVGGNFLNGNLHIAFFTLRADHTSDPPSQHRQVTLRLVLPLAGMLDLQKNLAGIMSILQQQGTIQPIMPGPQTRQ
jgi:hypothetical protein